MQKLLNAGLVSVTSWSRISSINSRWCLQIVNEAARGQTKRFHRLKFVVDLDRFQRLDGHFYDETQNSSRAQRSQFSAFVKTKHKMVIYKPMQTIQLDLKPLPFLKWTKAKWIKSNKNAEHGCVIISVYCYFWPTNVGTNVRPCLLLAYEESSANRTWYVSSQSRQKIKPYLIRTTWT